jgi:ribosome biogenesis protein BMS1
MQSGRKAEKQSRRKEEFEQKKLHVPLVDRTPLEPPPIIVAVAGPKGTGKSTLIRSLVKRYSNQIIHEINGPVTIVAGLYKAFIIPKEHNILTDPSFHCIQGKKDV